MPFDQTIINEMDKLWKTSNEEQRDRLIERDIFGNDVADDYVVPEKYSQNTQGAELVKEQMEADGWSFDIQNLPRSTLSAVRITNGNDTYQERIMPAYKAIGLVSLKVKNA